MTATTFTTVRDELHVADWPDSRHDLTTRIDGELADRIRARADRSGDVLLVEEGVEGGYSEYTGWWEFDVTVTVGGEVVWATTDGSATGGTESPSYAPVIERLLEWVDRG